LKKPMKERPAYETARPSQPCSRHVAVPPHDPQVSRPDGAPAQDASEAPRDGLAAMEKTGLRAVGEPVWARYDPPFMPWFLRTNEILIELAP